MGRQQDVAAQLLSKDDDSSSSLPPLPPEHILRLANLTKAEDRALVVAWTKVNPYSEVFCFVCSATMGVPCLLPCFWPHMVILSPCICGSIWSETNRIQSEHWILTDFDLKVVNTDYNICCIPGLYTSGDLVKTIPLVQITDAGLDSRGSGLCNCCFSDLDIIYVDTPSSALTKDINRGLGRLPGSQHEAYGVALQNSKKFLGQILQQQRWVRQGRQTLPPPSTATAKSMTMERGEYNQGVDVFRERIQKLQGLMDDGLITPQEFQDKRKELLTAL
jgi:hypothetical protein